MKNYTLPKRILYRSDPVACLLIETLHFSPVGFALLSIVTVAGLYLLAAWVSNTLWIEGGKGLFEDLLPWILVLLINPVVAGYYLWSFQSIASVIRVLEVSDVVETEESEIDRITHNFYHQRWRKFLALSCAGFCCFLFFLTRTGLKSGSWTSSASLPTLSTTAVTFAVTYMGFMLALNLIANVQVLHQILGEKTLNINPLHPDRCGGLRPLSDYSLKTAYLAAVVGLLVGLIEYQFIIQGLERVYWFVHLIIPLYIALSIACFFGPLLAAHKGMRRAKDELLNKIAQQFQVDYSYIYSNLNTDAEVLKKGSEKIKELQALYTMTDEFPVWPFDVETLNRFLLTIPAPFLPLLPKLIELLLQKWGVNIG